MTMGLRVTDLRGQRISPTQALGRTLAKFLSSATMIGFLRIVINRSYQGLHEIITITYIL
jgi:uncharacterized RDD family membrane protein YckC